MAFVRTDDFAIGTTFVVEIQCRFTHRNGLSRRLVHEHECRIQYSDAFGRCEGRDAFGKSVGDDADNVELNSSSDGGSAQNIGS